MAGSHNYRELAERQAELVQRLEDRTGCDTALRFANEQQLKLEQYAATAARWGEMMDTPMHLRPGGYPGDVYNKVRTVRYDPVQPE